MSGLKSLQEHFDTEDCTGGTGCRLKHYHSAVSSLKSSSQISSMIVVDDHPVPAAGLSATTRRSEAVTAGLDVPEFHDTLEDSDEDESEAVTAGLDVPEFHDTLEDSEYAGDVTRCVCQFVHDDGNMVQCDGCKVWQHIVCTDVNAEDVESQPYSCEECFPREMDVEKAKSLQKIVAEALELEEEREQRHGGARGRRGARGRGGPRGRRGTRGRGGLRGRRGARGRRGGRGRGVQGRGAASAQRCDGLDNSNMRRSRSSIPHGEVAISRPTNEGGEVAPHDCQSMNEQVTEEVTKEVIQESEVAPQVEMEEEFVVPNEGGEVAPHDGHSMNKEVIEESEVAPQVEMEEEFGHAEGASDSDYVIYKVTEKLKSFVKNIHEEIDDNVVDNFEMDVIERTRHILDFKQHIETMKIQKMSPEIYSVNNFAKFMRIVKSFEILTLTNINEDVIEIQFRKFIKILDQLSKEMEMEDSKEILKKMFQEKTIYSEIQIILHICCVMACKSSCESVVESLVSSYEYASDERKQYKESSINDVFEVIVNGPEVSKCEKICEIAMRNFFGDDEPHFYTKNPLFKESKVLRRLDQVKSSLPFMD